MTSVRAAKGLTHMSFRVSSATRGSDLSQPVNTSFYGHKICISTGKGTTVSGDIYIKPPPEAESEGTLWKVKKCVYGLADASLLVLRAGGKISQVDPAVFCWLGQDYTVCYCKETGSVIML